MIGTTSIEKGCIEKLLMCRDKYLDATNLMINTTTKDQYKLLLEQESNGYVFPSDSSYPQPHSIQQISSRTASESEWEIFDSDSVAFASAAEKKYRENVDLTAGPSNDETTSKIFPAARARFLSLKDMGAKKIVNLKLKLAESIIKAKGMEKMKDQTSAFSVISSNAITPELLTTPSGPYFIVQKAQNKNLLSALHSYSDTLSVS